MKRPTYKPCAFTLVELLVALAILAILAAILLPVVSNLRNKAERAGALSQLRTAGAGIGLYLNEHDGRLPGPLLGGQVPIYNSSPQFFLGSLIWPYLDLPEPEAQYQLAEPLVPYWMSETPKDVIISQRLPAYLANTTAGGDEGNIFGYPNAGDNPAQQPWIYMKVLEEFSPSEVWALMEIDQKIWAGSDSKPGWYNEIPAEPSGGNERLALFFDWHVGPIPVDSP